MIGRRHRLLAAVLLAAAAAAQQGGDVPVQVAGPDPGVVVYPQASRILIRIETDGDAPTPRLPVVDGINLRLSGPNRQSNMQIIGGRMESRTWIDWIVLAQPQRVGEFTIPPIAVTVGGKEYRTPELQLRAVRDMEGADHGFVTMQVQPRRVYVHEPLRVRVQVGLDQGLKLVTGQANNGQSYLNVQVIAPWLDGIDGTVPIEGAAAPGQRRVNLVHQQALFPVEYEENVERDGRRFLVARFERAFLPSRTGRLTVPSLAIGFNAETGKYREVEDFFARRRVPETKTFYLDAPAVEVEVLPLPDEGRPDPFYGAVGRFTVRASADRERVKVGSSVKLTLTIEGDGNTEFLQAPQLETGASLHLLGTKEKREVRRVEVTYDVTPLSAEVTALPAVRWNWFDTTPGVERYVEAATEPIPITVEALPEGEGLAPRPGEETSLLTPGVDDIFDMKPLAEGEPVAAPRARPALGWLALLLPWLLVGWLAVLRRVLVERAADVRGRRERGAARAFRRRLQDGTALDALVGYLADRLDVAEAAVVAPDLRERIAACGLEGELLDAVVQAVETGVAARYGGGSTLTAAEAEALVQRLETVRLRAADRGGIGAAGALVLVAALAPASLTAQDPVTAAAEASYRAGDYGRAAELWRQACAARGDADRRLFYNLGNALYRSGDPARALAAWESARPAMPRDRELLANIALVRRQLDLGGGDGGQPFLQALAELRDSLRVDERAWLCAALHALAALCIVFGRRRALALAAAAVVAVPAALLTVDLLWLTPSRPAKAFVAADRAEVVAEPRTGLEAVVKLRRGAELAVLAPGARWTRVRAGDRTGYVDSSRLALVE